MDPAQLGIRLASGVIAPLVKKLFTSNPPGAGLIDKPIRVSALVSFRGEKRTLTDTDLRKIAAEIVRRAVQAAGPHDPLLEDEEVAVVDALALTLHSIGDLDLDDLQAVQLGYENLATMLYSAAGGAELLKYLSEDAVRVYSEVLRLACLHILNFFTQRSTFIARTLIEQSRQLDALISAVDLLVERVPSRTAEDAYFESRYCSYIDNKYGRLTIYGIDLNESSEWPLDAAYLGLGVMESEHQHAAELEVNDPLRVEAWQPQRQAVEQALATKPAILLRGAAGSGKTTLVQWLAVTAARQADIRGPLAYLFGLVPFVLPLRTITREGGGLPTPEDFLRAAGCLVAGAAPVGWADRVLSSGRGLLLIDGIDEIPAEEREQARSWLRDLYETFPGNRWLVTSRPSAVRENWLFEEGFLEYDLLPMSRGEVEAFVKRWHSAAGADDVMADALIRALRTKKDLGRLAVNPLMCGLICALHRERRGFLPLGRKDLYEAALAMLLERRDRERSMHRAGGLVLPKEPQVQLLQKLAYWMIRNGRSEMRKADATAVLADALLAMPYIQASPEEVFQHLLLRSGLLREPVLGAVDFVHRTFQDYLGAKAAVEARDIPSLIDHADKDQWEDVVRLSVAHARMDERSEIMEGLLSRGERQPEIRSRMYLLAAACLEHATELPAEIRAEVETCAQDLISPEALSASNMYELIHAGPVVLEFLPGPDGLDDATAALIVKIASEIGTEAAIGVLSQFRRHRALDVRKTLVDAWPRFDSEEYATEIIAYLYPQGIQFPVQSDGELEALAKLGGRPRVSICGAVNLDHLMNFPEASVTELIISWEERGDGGISDIDLSVLQHFRSLERLTLVPCYGLVDLEPLSLIYSLREIVIREATFVRGMESLDGVEVDCAGVYG
ncbi:NACHT domain-containing protein [Streptomyces phaeoluteigriseus]|uniref:NACHT domain-containing protein n=1 Tax=Streptomyces phaeoluteigriseus TaxID=114686 RepID=A0ABY4Z3Q1_9ACTN|nr:NACHT domain-containing protein [Streptomyces phaeoluteigriseus]USQ83477.1 NACHT domain-containing protein [Streptomyces phaeoluteigriseus]